MYRIYLVNRSIPGIITIQGMLRKIDCLRLPLASRRDVESILVRQVSKEIDRALPWQAGHGRRTAAISLLIGQAVGLTTGELHDLKLAAFLHDIGLLMLPQDPPHRGQGTARFRILRRRSESSSAWRDTARTILLPKRGFDPNRAPSRTMGRIGLSVWYQRTIHPSWSSRILLDRRCLRCHQYPCSLECESCETRIALRILLAAAGTQFDPDLVEALWLFQESIPYSDLIEPTMRNCFDSH